MTPKPTQRCRDCRAFAATRLIPVCRDCREAAQPRETCPAVDMRPFTRRSFYSAEVTR